MNDARFIHPRPSPLGRSLWHATLASSLLAVLLASCGGGGGGGGGGGTSVSVSGKATFDSVPAISGGSLNYNATVRAPVRGATVQLIDGGGSVIGTTTSDSQGNYALSGTSSSGSVRVRVLAEVKGANHDFSVRDNTDNATMWAMESATLTTGSGLVQDVHAPSGWGGTSYNATRVAGPFAVLDIAYLVQQKIAAVAPAQVLSPLSIYWSPNNRPVGGKNLALGEIGTSFFSQDSAGKRALYILGAENVDTDEYDSSVIAHELGHYLQSVISRDDSVGGPHTGNDRLDMRVAFSEGWGNAWASMVRDTPIYVDTQGARQAQGFSYSVATAPSTQGWYSEGTVEYLLWNDYQDPSIGLGGIYAALADMRDSPWFSSIFSFNTALSSARPAAASGIASRSASVGVNGTDGYGTGETNGGGITGSLPVYALHDVAQGVAKTYCVSADVGKPNKLRNFAFVRFTASGSRTITVARSASTVEATDPDVEIITSQGVALAPFQSTAANVENVVTSLPSGTHVMAIDDFELIDGASPGTRCFTVTIN